MKKKEVKRSKERRKRNVKSGGKENLGGGTRLGRHRSRVKKIGVRLIDTTFSKEKFRRHFIDILLKSN
jgi:hypothetical protein